MPHYTRRDFLKTGLAAGAFAFAGSLPLRAGARTATDWVTLGKSGVRVTRLAFGTGSFSGQVQRDLGQEQFTRLVRYAYDQGIRFFETAETYGEMHKMLGVALKGIPRDNYRLMSKVTTREVGNPLRPIQLADATGPEGMYDFASAEFGRGGIHLQQKYCVINLRLSLKKQRRVARHLKRRVSKSF